MPTGGVDLTTAADFLKSGACCLGVGGNWSNRKRWPSATSTASGSWPGSMSPSCGKHGAHV